MNEIEMIISRLEEISERLNDVAMGIISDAIEQGQTARPPLEKRVSQARRAVDKAIHNLRND